MRGDGERAKTKFFPNLSHVGDFDERLDDESA